jgi:hypothetical protein
MKVYFNINKARKILNRKYILFMNSKYNKYKTFSFFSFTLYKSNNKLRYLLGKHLNQ